MKLKHDKLLSKVAFNCNMRLYTTVIGNGTMLGVTPLRNKRSHGTLGRALHGVHFLSSTAAFVYP